MNHSLLSLVLQDEKVTSILNNLRQSVQYSKQFHIPSEDIAYIQKKFQMGIAYGEKGLHDLSFQIIHSFASLTDAKTTLIVWGRCPDQHHPEIVKSYTHIEMGEVLTSKYMDSMIAWSHSPSCKMCGKKTNTIASFNQYKFTQNYPSGLKIMLSRIKTTSNVCYKIADIVFDIDRMFQRDKIVNRYTQALTDMYGIKMAFSKIDHIYKAIEFFKTQEDMEVIEEKDYLGVKKKKSGYEAYKIVLKKNDQLFELQLQTNRMLEVEKSSLTANHKTYKEKQMEERRSLGDAYQNFYDVLIQIFSSTHDHIDYKEV